MAQLSTEACRRHIIFCGHVQGVGFRYTTRNVAINYDVTGFVRNLPDGRVELVAEGPPTEINHFVNAIADRMRGHIHDVDVKEEPPSGQFTHFVISR